MNIYLPIGMPPGPGGPNQQRGPNPQGETQSPEKGVWFS